MSVNARNLRLGTERNKTAFLFDRVGLADCDMGVCAILPRIIGQGRASELLYTGSSFGGEEGERWGAGSTGCVHPRRCTVRRWRRRVFTSQAICRLTEDSERACRAFAARSKPVLQGN